MQNVKPPEIFSFSQSFRGAHWLLCVRAARGKDLIFFPSVARVRKKSEPLALENFFSLRS